MVGNQNLEVLKPIDKVSLGEITSHRAVTTVNANVASKQLDPRAEPAAAATADIFRARPAEIR